MRDDSVITVPKRVKEHALIDFAEYQAMYQQSIDAPEKFWEKQAHDLLDWHAPWENIFKKNEKLKTTSWFYGGRINACYNCLDRHLTHHGDKPAIIWECDDPGVNKTLSYKELHALVCRFANVLKSRGVKKGDRVCIYMPMIPEIAVAMLACTRIGAVHCVVFGGFSSDMLAERINDADCKVIVTADEIIRGGKHIPIKATVEKALERCKHVHTTIIVQRTGNPVPMNHERDIWYHDAMVYTSSECPCEIMQAQDPLFIIYTSGSTGKPKGIVHATAGYLLHCAISFKYVFDYHDNEVFWSSADMGWITGHSYALYGPLLNAATTLMYEGTPYFPSYSRYWQIIDKHQVNIFYTAPTIIRSLMAQGKASLRGVSLKSLRILGSVGEPINADAWQWFYDEIGKGQCALLDTWWQSETGAICISPLVALNQFKPGSAGQPFFGVDVAIVDEDGNELEGEARGYLAIKSSWPGQMQSIYGDHQRYLDTYYNHPSGYYITGDGARRDNDGYYWLTGRIDDFINVSGHRLGTAIIENALTGNDNVAEAAVVGYPHPIKGQGIYAFVVLKANTKVDNVLKNELMSSVINRIGAIAKPDIIQWASGLPKTRSGKIVRHLLRKIAAGEVDDKFDLSDLVDAEVMQELMKNAKQIQLENNK